jgi:uncharacterized protein (DUF2164 family)
VARVIRLSKAERSVGFAVGDLKARLLLEYCLEEIGPSIYNQAIADAQSYFTGRVADLEGVCHEEEFGFWPRE